MDTISLKKLVIPKLRNTSEPLVQEGFVAFTEKPSDKFGIASMEPECEGITRRITACELFSLFTADIIKAKAVFVR